MRGVVQRSALAALGAAVLTAASAPCRADLDAGSRRKAFEAVWGRINESHFDPTFGGVDWKAVRRKYAPLAEKARTDAEFYGVLQQMVGELKQSHFAIIPPKAYALADAAAGGGAGTSGITLAVIDGQAVAIAVTEGSAGAAAGIRPGDVIESAAGKKLAEVAAEVEKKAAVLRPGERAVVARMLVQRALSGKPGAMIPLTVRGEDDQTRTVELTLGPAAVRREAALPGFPPMPAEAASRRLDGNVGYVRFNLFTALTMGDLRKALEGMADASGIVIDLRGNPGGLAPVTYAVAGMVSPKPGSLGTMAMRGATLKFNVTPQAPAFPGPVAVLTDELSMSCSEILAGGLKVMGRAAVIGRATPGMVLPSTIYALPGGARLQYAFADFRTTDGKLLEGRGVTPDVPVPLTRARLYAEGDPDLKAAVDYIRSKSDSAKKVSQK